MMNQTLESISFDRAAETYDQTRALPEGIARELTGALLSEIAAAGADRILEVGVGTGRIARPLAERGIRVLAIDISPRMLARLREQVEPSQMQPDLILGDATRLPLASESFPAVLVFHVLHLVSPWQTALEELRRVLAPGGILVCDGTEAARVGEAMLEEWRAAMSKLREMMAARNFVAHTRPSTDEIRGTLQTLGGSCRVVPFAEGEIRRTPAQNLERIRNRVDSWTWEIPEDLFAECLSELESWYSRHYSNMDEEIVRPVAYCLDVWRFGQLAPT